MTILPARAWFRYYADRLRETLAEPELVTDSDLLVLLNEAYKRLCEHSGCLPTITPVTLVPGQSEYSLPADWYETRSVSVAGELIDQISLFKSLTGYGQGVPIAYYSYGQTIGFAPRPNTAGTVQLLYHATPSLVAGYDDDLDARLLPEYRYGIVHYVRWRLLQMDGGAQGITKADYERSLYDDCVRRLRDGSRNTVRTTPPRMRTALEAAHAR